MRNAVLRLRWKESGGARFASADVFRIETGAVVFGGPEPSSDLVGQRHGGLVVPSSAANRVSY